MDTYSFSGLAAYCVVADESVGRQVPMAFLERIRDDFVSRYGGEKAATAPANSLNKDFRYSFSNLERHFGRVFICCWKGLRCSSKLKEHMQYCVDHPEEISKLAKVKDQVSEVKGVMMENIEKVKLHCLATFYGFFFPVRSHSVCKRRSRQRVPIFPPPLTKSRKIKLSREIQARIWFTLMRDKNSTGMRMQWGELGGFFCMLQPSGDRFWRPINGFRVVYTIFITE